jgi:cytochrome c oxidase assembly protein subunit 15
MSKSLHRHAMLVVILAIAVMVSGAVITSGNAASRHSAGAVAMIGGERWHQALAFASFVLTLGLAVRASVEGARRWVVVAAWASVATLAAAALMGWTAQRPSAWIAVFHALLGHLFVSLACAVAVGTSLLWQQPPELASGSSKPFLRPLTIATPPVVFLQITLGAAYRHDLTSVMPHMAFAMAVAFLALIGASGVLQNVPGPVPLRRAAIALISVVLLQVSLGIGAFLMIALNSSGTIYFVLITAAHVMVGALTLAASVVMAMQVRRNIPRRSGTESLGPV